MVMIVNLVLFKCIVRNFLFKLITMKYLFQSSFIYTFKGGKLLRLLLKDTTRISATYPGTLDWVKRNFVKKRNLNIISNVLLSDLIELTISFTRLNFNFYEFITFIFGIRNINFIRLPMLFNSEIISLTGFELMLVQQPKLVNTKVSAKPFIYFSVLESTSEIMLAEFAIKHPELVINNNGKLQLDEKKFNAYQEKLLLEVDKEFRTKLITRRPLFDSSPEDLYEFKQIAPFKTNSNYVRLVDFQASTDEWYELLS